MVVAIRREIVAKIETYITSPFLNITTEISDLLDHRVDGSHLKPCHKLEAGFITAKRGVHGMSTLSQSIFDLAEEGKEFGLRGSQVVSIRVDESTISHQKGSRRFGGQWEKCHTTS